MSLTRLRPFRAVVSGDEHVLDTPGGLGPAGVKLWTDVAGVYELRPDELVILEQAYRTLTWVERMEAELATSPLTVAGSMGQTREHPLLSEARQQRALLGRQLAQLGLPDEQESTGDRTMKLARSQIGRQAARARWSS